MNVLREAASTLRPPAGDRHGPLAPMLVGLTVVTGVVDAVSYLTLGHVFVANMTGNVVFIGFALAGASGLSAPASLAALAAFLRRARCWEDVLGAPLPRPPRAPAARRRRRAERAVRRRPGRLAGRIRILHAVACATRCWFRSRSGWASRTPPPSGWPCPS